MAEDPNSKAPAGAAPDAAGSPAPVDTATSPSPVEVAGEAQPAAGAEAQPSGGPDATALSDGTVPTILSKGDANGPKGKVPKGPRSLGRLYQRADIVTTLVTFIGAAVAAGLILGAYVFLNQKSAKTPATAGTGTTKVTTLSKDDLAKLGTFLGTSGGGSAEVLTISSAALFQKPVAVSSDMKITGGLTVSGSTELGDLAVNKTTTLSVTNIRAALTVTGPLNQQGPASFNAGATVKGDISATGNGTFGGSLAASSISTSNLAVAGNLNLAGHINITGQNPTVAPASEAGAGASTTVDGNDSAGTVNINSGTATSAALQFGGLLATVTFNKEYARSPRVIITPVGQSASELAYYVQRTSKGFTIGFTKGLRSSTSYAFDYWIVQ